ncbi:MAG TPA: amidohydrolase family protein [Balneolaceae bacterium]
MLSIHTFPKIDAHIHFNADRSHLLELAKKFGFSLITINTEVPFFPSIDDQQELAKTYHRTSDTDLFNLTTVSTEEIVQPAWAEKAIGKIKHDIAAGALGVKFWKNIGMSIQRKDDSFIMLDDTELKPVFDFLEDRKIPVLGHQGEPKNCWLPVEEMTVKSDREYFAAHPEYHMHLHDEFPDYIEHINSRDHILERHPDLIFIGAHIASLEWSLEEVGRRLDRFPNLAIDLAERISHLEYHTARDRNKVIDFFHKYQDRILYGTDIIDDPAANPAEIAAELEQRWKKHWLFLSTDEEIYSAQIDDSFNGLALPEKILEKIYRLNALKWYHLSDQK